MIPFSVKSVMNIEMVDLNRRSMQDILDRSERYMQQKKFDSAMGSLSMIISRYDKSMPAEEQKLVTNALLGRWLIYSMVYGNQSRAMEDLYKALKICETNGFKRSRIYLNYGCMFLTLATPTMDTMMNRKSYSYLAKAMDLAKAERDTDVYSTAFLNLVTVAYGIDSLGSLKGKYNEYRRSPLARQHPYYEYGRNLYEGHISQYEGQYDRALKIFTDLASLVRKKQWGPAMLLNCYLWQVDALVGKKATDKALLLLDSIEAEASRNDMKDMLLIAYKYKHELLKDMGRKDEADRYMLSFYSLKDSLQNYQQTVSVNSFGLEQQLIEMNDTVETLNSQKRTRSVIIIVTLPIVAVVVIALIFMRRKNRQLNRANIKLYKKSLETLAREQEHLEKIKDQESMLTDIARRAEVQSEKYSGSTLDEEQKDVVMDKILNIVSQNKEVFSPDFSLTRLTELSGIGYKIISQVINEKTGSNFNVFINEFRVKEACRLINDPENASRYTLEHIGEMVGFKSRPSFNAAFKRCTGMTPSAYQKIVKQSRENPGKLEE